MTILIALKDHENKKTIIGSDRQGTCSDIASDWGHEKYLKINIPTTNDDEDVTVYFLISGSSFLQSYLANVFQPPKYDTTDNMLSYLYNHFFKELREELLQYKVVGEQNNIVDTESASLLIYKDEIYSVSDDFTIQENELYGINGAGWKIALSVLVNNLRFHKELSKYDIVKEALLTTGQLNLYCNEDIDITEINWG